MNKYHEVIRFVALIVAGVLLPILFVALLALYLMSGIVSFELVFLIGAVADGFCLFILGFGVLIVCIYLWRMIVKVWKEILEGENVSFFI